MNSQLPPHPAVRNKTSKHRRGFNLIEAAIVLGVVGLVIGGIWIAASSVKSKLFTRDMVAYVTSALETIRQNARLLSTNTSTELNLHSLLTAGPLVGSPIDYSHICLGTPGFCANFNHSGNIPPAGHIYGEFAFVNNPSAYSGWTTNTELCVELSKLLLRQSYVDPLIAWVQNVPSAVGVGTWTGGAQPSATQILTYCATAQAINYSGMAP